MPASQYAPQLATLVHAPPSGPEWIHEIKFDGYRIGCVIRNGRVTLYSRTGKDWTAAFPTVAEAAAALGLRDALLDGEVASVLPDGRTSFQALQNSSGDGVRNDSPRGAIVYFVFDLLRLEGERLDNLPLEDRKKRLRRLFGRRKAGRLRYAAHVDGDGLVFLEHARRLGLEGIISKRRDLPYRPGRHGDWLKVKCVKRQEFVIGGFTDPEGAREGFGALVIGHYDRARLVCAGRVGTGFTRKTTVELRKRLDTLSQSACPFTPPPPGPLGRRAHWVKPVLVCEVAFTEWTTDGNIRHPSFQGLRSDKRATDVVRERPA